MNSNWMVLEQKIFLELKDFNPVLKDKRVLVAVSAGSDSIALFAVLRSLASYFKFKIGVLHIHHGDHENTEFRNRAANFCSDLARNSKVEFIQIKNTSSLLVSEADFRKFRLQAYLKLLKEWDFVALGHHAEDLLETRLLRLIRGTGAQGLQSMSLLNARRLRPFLHISKAEILSYLQQTQMNYLDDPSNSDSKYLRNWLRNEWLPLLELKVPGSLFSFARSLEFISGLAIEQTTVMKSKIKKHGQAYGITKSFYLTLSQHERSVLVALMLKKIKKLDFSSGQIREILKQLDKDQIVHSFSYVGLTWEVNAGQIWVRRKEKS